MITAKTNAKGKATFKITKLTKKGKFTAVIKYAGNKYYNKLSKKAKYTAKITYNGNKYFKKLTKKVKIINEIKKSHLDSETNSNKGIEMIMIICVVFSPT